VLLYDAIQKEYIMLLEQIFNKRFIITFLILLLYFPATAGADNTGKETFLSKTSSYMMDNIKSFQKKEILSDFPVYTASSADVVTNNRRDKNFSVVAVDPSHPEYHSPWIAVGLSVLPLWSGSWNAGFTIWGLGFVFMKSMIWISIPLEGMDGFSTGEKFALPYGIISLVGTVADIIYSYNRISNYNRRTAAAAKNEKRLFISMLPRYFKNSEMNFNNINNYSIDGINIQASLRF